MNLVQLDDFVNISKTHLKTYRSSINELNVDSLLSKASELAANCFSLRDRWDAYSLARFELKLETEEAAELREKYDENKHMYRFGEDAIFHDENAVRKRIKRLENAGIKEGDLHRIYYHGNKLNQEIERQARSAWLGAVSTYQTTTNYAVYPTSHQKWIFDGAEKPNLVKWISHLSAQYKLNIEKTRAQIQREANIGILEGLNENLLSIGSRLESIKYTNKWQDAILNAGWNTVEKKEIASKRTGEILDYELRLKLIRKRFEDGYCEFVAICESLHDGLVELYANFNLPLPIDSNGAKKNPYQGKLDAMANWLRQVLRFLRSENEQDQFFLKMVSLKDKLGAKYEKYIEGEQAEIFLNDKDFTDMSLLRLRGIGAYVVTSTDRELFEMSISHKMNNTRRKLPKVNLGKVTSWRADTVSDVAGALVWNNVSPIGLWHISPPASVVKIPGTVVDDVLLELHVAYRQN